MPSFNDQKPRPQSPILIFDKYLIRFPVLSGRMHYIGIWFILKINWQKDNYCLMKIVCTHFKGGVGKSTTAIHVVGALLAMQKHVLLIDGDRQTTSYEFFNEGQKPLSYEPIDVDEQLIVTPLYEAKPVNGVHLGERLNKIKKYYRDCMVVDTTPDSHLVNQLISEIDPDVIIIPVKHDDMGGHKQLTGLLHNIGVLAAIGITPKVIVLPIGGDKSNITPYLPPNTDLLLEFAETMPFNSELVGKAVFEESRFVWEYEAGEVYYSIYTKLIEEAENGR